MRKVAGMVLLTLLISVVFFAIYGIPRGMIQAQKESKHYLEDKYDEVFQVKMPRFCDDGRHLSCRSRACCST